MRDGGAVRRHVSQTGSCRTAHIASLNQARTNAHRPALMGIGLNHGDGMPPVDDGGVAGGVDMDMDMDGIVDNLAAEVQNIGQNINANLNAINAPPALQDPRAIPVREIQQLHKTLYGGNAGKPVDKVKRDTKFKTIAKSYPLDDDNAFGPFKSEKEWDFAEYCVKTLGHGEMNRLLDLDYVSVPSIGECVSKL